MSCFADNFLWELTDPSGILTWLLFEVQVQGPGSMAAIRSWLQVAVFLSSCSWRTLQPWWVWSQSWLPVNTLYLCAVWMPAISSSVAENAIWYQALWRKVGLYKGVSALCMFYPSLLWSHGVRLICLHRYSIRGDLVKYIKIHLVCSLF